MFPKLFQKVFPKVSPNCSQKCSRKCLLCVPKKVPKSAPKNVPERVFEWFPESVPENLLRYFPQKFSSSVTEIFSNVPPVKCSPYLEVGVESISVAIFVVYIFVIFWSDIWLKTIILFWTTWWRPNRLKPNVKCKIVSCVLLHGIQWTTLYYTICSRLLDRTTTLQCSNIMY